MDDLNLILFIKSFLRRIKFKSSLYFALLAVPVWFFFRTDPMEVLMGVCTTSTMLLALANIQRHLDKKKTTGILCKICGNQNSVILYPARRKNQKLTGDFACSSFDHANYPDIFYCPHCLNGFLRPIAELTANEMGANARKEYEGVVDEEYVANLPARHQTAQAIVKSLESNLTNKDILEIGAYYGAFATQVQGHCRSYTGIEPSKHACLFVEKEYGLKIHNGLIEDIPRIIPEDKKFDTVIMFDVIEHLTDPLEALQTIHKYLRPGGEVIFTTINIESTFSMVLGPYWPWYMDMHYWYFSDRGYVDILHRTGYILKTHQHFSYFVRPSYFVEKALSCIGIRTSFFEKFLPKTPFKITLGDTVMIKGQKV